MCSYPHRFACGCVCLIFVVQRKNMFFFGCPLHPWFFKGRLKRKAELHGRLQSPLRVSHPPAPLREGETVQPLEKIPRLTVTKREVQPLPAVQAPRFATSRLRRRQNPGARTGAKRGFQKFPSTASFGDVVFSPPPFFAEQWKAFWICLFGESVINVNQRKVSSESGAGCLYFF